MKIKTIIFSIIMVGFIAGCSSSSHEENPYQDVVHDSSASAVADSISSIPTTYCCSNHVDAPHCGTQEELGNLSNSYGCTGFH